MKTCKNCKHYDSEPWDNGAGECLQQPLGSGSWKIVDEDNYCFRYRKVLPTVISVCKDFYEMYQVVILEWNVDTGEYEVAFTANKSWTNIDDAIDEAVDINYEEAEYVALNKLAYPCQLTCGE